MMHRYVAIISTTDTISHHEIHKKIRRYLSDWTQVLNSNLANAWVFSAAPSALGHRRLSASGCVIGRDFQPDSHEISTLTKDTWGAYVAISVNEDLASVTVLRDPTGRIDCWRLRLRGVDVLFSHYQDISWLRTEPKVNWDYLSFHLRQGNLHGHQTGLSDITEVLPGEELRYCAGECSQQFRWWPHEIAATSHATIDEAQLAIRKAGEEVVTAWGKCYKRISLDLSGGLDSSIVLGLLRRHALHRDVAGVNWITTGEEGDERPYARAAAEMHGVTLVDQHLVSQDINFSTPFSACLIRPKPQILPMGFNELGSNLARQYGSDAIFTGSGGDHLFFDHLPITAARDYFHHGGSVTGFLRQAVGLAQVSKSTVWQISKTVAKSYFNSRPEPSELGWPNNPFLADDASSAGCAEQYIHPWAMAAVKHAPPAKLLQILHLIELQRHYARFGRVDIAEEVLPLFSQPLVEACLRTPAYWFCVGGIQRGLARRAFSDLLPEMIRSRRTKGGNTAFLLQFFGQRLSRIRELLLDGHMAGRGLLNRGAIERATTPLAIAAGKNLGALSTCLTSELWVQQVLSKSSPLSEKIGRYAQ